jgi:HSP20 family protein
MSLFDPFADLNRLRQQLDRLYEDQASARKPQEGGRAWRPAVDLFEDADALTLKVDLPDVDRESIDVQLTGEELVVRGERTWVAPSQGTCVHSERPFGQFHRAFRLGLPVQHDAVEADYREGVLTVRLPKAETVKPRKVAVKSGEEASAA